MKPESIGKHKRKFELAILAGSIAAFLFAVKLNTLTVKPDITIDKQDSTFNIKSPFLIAFSFGNKRMFADFLWVKTLIESDVEKYRGEKFNNWMFLRFKTISDLDPLFYENYLFGGQFLSIVKDDMEAASVIYEKGLLYYPNDYDLNYNAGVNYYFELEDYTNGINKLKLIQDHPKAPRYIKSIVNKLTLEVTQDYELVLNVIDDLIKKNKDPAILSRLHNDFFSIKAERDLECLNAGKKNCELKDSQGDAYRLVNGKYQAAREFIPYRIKKKRTR